MRNRVFRYLTLAAALAVLSSACLADLLQEGRDLYKAGKYAGAAGRLEQSTQSEPQNAAKAWWQLNFAYHKLGREQDSLNAVKKAGELDPQHTFASEPGKYQEILSDRQSKVGGAAPGQSAIHNPQSAIGSVRNPQSAVSGSSRAGSGGGGITQQLMNGDVYAEPGINVDVARLQQTATELRPTIVKFAVFNSRSNSTTLKREADRIRNYLSAYMQNGRGYVIAASRRGVAVSSPSLSASTEKQLVGKYAPMMEAGDYTGGLVGLAHDLVQTHQTQQAHTRATWIIVLAVIAGVLIIWWVLKSAAKARAMAAAREPLEQQRSQVISDLNFLDDNARIMEGSAAAQVREARAAAGTKLDQASRIMASAHSDTELGRAASLLNQAQNDISRGKAAIDRASGGSPVGATAATSAASAASSAAPPVYPAGAQTSTPTTDWGAVQNDEKGVCFFCSRPMFLRELTPVTVNLNGQQQKVLACPDDLATIKSGQVPQIRAFQDNGRYVPWYAYQNYDPYRDYYSRGYGGGNLMTDLITLSLIDNMFWNWHHPMGWGWGGGWGGGNTYVFYPDHETYRDYYSNQAGGYGDFDRTPDAAGADFLQDTGGDVGGADFVGTDRS